MLLDATFRILVARCLLRYRPFCLRGVRFIGASWHFALQSKLAAFTRFPFVFGGRFVPTVWNSSLVPCFLKHVSRNNKTSMLEWPLRVGLRVHSFSLLPCRSGYAGSVQPVEVGVAPIHPQCFSPAAGHVESCLKRRLFSTFGILDMQPRGTHPHGRRSPNPQRETAWPATV